MPKKETTDTSSRIVPTTSRGQVTTTTDNAGASLKVAPGATGTSFKPGGGATGGIVRYKSGYMDVKHESADAVTAAGLVAAHSSKSVAECGAQLAVYEKTGANLDVAIAEQGIIQKGIRLKREEINTSTEAYKLSSAIEKNLQAGDQAKHDNFMTGVKATTNQHKRTHAVANEKIWRHRAGAAVARANKTELEGYGNITDVEFTNMPQTATAGGSTNVID